MASSYHCLKKVGSLGHRQALGFAGSGFGLGFEWGLRGLVKGSV